MARRLPVEISPRAKALPPYVFGELNAIKYRLRCSGVDIIDLGMGNPMDSTPTPVIEKLREAVRDPRNHRYSVPQGVFNLRQAAADHYLRRWHAKVDPEREIVCTIGSKEGISHLCLALLGRGDVVLVGSPIFPIHEHAPQLAGATVVTFPLGSEEEMLRDIHDQCQRMRPRPKMLILNFPHNPTAATVDVGFYRQVVRLARKFGFLVLQDFAYGATVFDGWDAPSFLSVPGARDVGVEFTTMSKEFNMAGWRVGFCAGHPDMVGALRGIKGYYDYGIFQAVQVAAITALSECHDEAREQAAIYQVRRDALCDGLRRIGWPVEPPRASMFVWIPIPEPFRKHGSVGFALKLLRQAGVATAPGSAFGVDGEGFLRLAIVENEQRLKQAVRQIGRRFGLSSLYKKRKRKRKR
ncbi:MAG: aminotransferase class I/II-fold pyridoxal phosphate-dependent enzyme [Bradyrhizobium sp.]|nr:aminotransferase class I/II-fold pyridoxal phosphate-dependent enzyme [Bradyrhizobium sp.]